MFEALKKNLEQEKEIVVDMKAVAVGVHDDPENRDVYLKSLKSLAEHLDVLNNAVPELLKESSPIIKQSGHRPYDQLNQKLKYYLRLPDSR